MTTIGLQLYTIREQAEQDLLGTFEKVASMGYEAVQFAGFFGMQPQRVRAVLDEWGLKRAGSHIGWEQWDQSDAVFAYHEQIGNPLLICPYLPEALRQTAEDYRRVAERLNTIGRECQRAGFTFAYHHHDFEFQPLENTCRFEVLVAETDPDWVKLELDCYWLAYTGNNPLTVMEKHADRLVSLHLKDLRETENGTVSTEVGAGQLNWPPIIGKAREWGVEWLTVEQEHFDTDPLTHVERSLIALRVMME